MGLPLKRFIPQLGLPKGFLLPSNSNRWFVMAYAALPGFLGEPLKIASYGEKPPILKFLASQAQILEPAFLKKLPLAFFGFALALSLALPLALEFTKKCIWHSLDMLQNCL